nr:Peptidoglycan synthase FtsI precursor [Candidatus Pantoea persica]
MPSRDVIADPLRVLEANPDFLSAKWAYLASQITANPKRRFLYLGPRTQN